MQCVKIKLTGGKMIKFYRFARKGKRYKLEYQKTMSYLPELSYSYIMRVDTRRIMLALLQGGKV